VASSKQGLQLQDYEESLTAQVGYLSLLYAKNGGQETERVVVTLLKNIHRLTPYLEDVLKEVKDLIASLPAEKQVRLRKLLEPIEEAVSSREK
jgi:hypothetical protein